MEAEERTQGLRRLKAAARQTGGPESMAARMREGTGTARDRLARLLDAQSFVELDLFTAGMVAGRGRIGGRDVYVWAEDPVLGRRHGVARAAAKAAKVIDLALKTGVPIVSLHDGGAAPVGEGWPPGAYGEILFRQVMASGVVPQLSVILGACAGVSSLSPVLADFTVMVKGAGRLLLAEGEAPGEAPFPEQRGGCLHLAVGDEETGLDAVARLLSYLPQNNLEDPPLVPTPDPVTRQTEALEGLIAGAARIPGEGAGGSATEEAAVYDIRQVLRIVFDEGGFLELMPAWGAGVVVGFARLGGRAVGVVANDPGVEAGCLDVDGADKAARFIRTCDAFNVPLVTLVDSPGFRAEAGQEYAASARHAAKLLYAYCEATVPKLTLVMRRAYGAAYEVMGSKHARSDFCFAWPWVQISPTASWAAKLERRLLPVLAAAKRGLVDDVIEPAETRGCLAMALEACLSKREGRPPKKHGNPPA
jgi:acetyl-CoA carboxylase carboxyltransferase component